MAGRRKRHYRSRQPIRSRRKSHKVSRKRKSATGVILKKLHAAAKSDKKTKNDNRINKPIDRQQQDKRVKDNIGIATECPAPALYIFVRNLQNCGLVVRADTPRDGNCFFHAIRDQLLRIHSAKSAMTVHDLRSFCVKYLLRNPTLPDGTELRHFTNYGKWEVYLAQMALPKVWVDDVMVLAMACVLRRPLVIVTTVEDSRFIKEQSVSNHKSDKHVKSKLVKRAPFIVMDPFPVIEDPSRRRPLLLGLLNGHYLSLTPADPDPPGSSEIVDSVSSNGVSISDHSSRRHGHNERAIQNEVYQSHSRTSTVSFKSVASLEELKETKDGDDVLKRLTDRKRRNVIIDTANSNAKASRRF